MFLGPYGGRFEGFRDNLAGTRGRWERRKESVTGGSFTRNRSFREKNCGARFVIGIALGTKVKKGKSLSSRMGVGSRMETDEGARRDSLAACFSAAS